jgi:hypothetical protein
VSDGKDVYFLHHSEIVEGRDFVVIGQPVEFDVAPALPGTKFARAVNAKIGQPAPSSAAVNGEAR